MNAILRLQPPLLVTFGPPCVQRKTEKVSKTDNFFATFRQFLYSPGKKMRKNYAMLTSAIIERKYDEYFDRAYITE